MYYLLVQLLMPFTFTCLLTWLALNYLWRRCTRPVRWLALVLSLASLTMVSSPPVAYLSLGSLEWRYPPQDSSPSDYQAIVVLGGHVQWADAVRPNPTLGEDSTARCLHASTLYQAGPACPVVVCGGNVDHVNPGLTIAEVMRDFLITQGVDARDLIVEKTSRNTFQNAVEACKLLRQRGLSRAVVVSDATHLLRAGRCFRAQGMPVRLSGCRYRATRFLWSPLSFLPDPHAAAAVQDAAHEWLGITWYWFHGRI